MISNLAVLLLAIAKAGTMCGVLPGMILAAFFRSRGSKFFCPPSLGKSYRVLGYHTGDFIGKVVSVDRTFAKVRVTDPMRPGPCVKNRCAFPQCVREDFHHGDHEFVCMRAGAVIDVAWESAQWIPETSSGGGQLALAPSGVGRSSVSLATSPPRIETGEPQTLVGKGLK
jgi:hypothetical protein